MTSMTSMTSMTTSTSTVTKTSTTDQATALSKGRPKARKLLLNEFKFTDKGKKILEDKLNQEPYNMRKNPKTGEHYASTQFKVSIEMFWCWNNSKKVFGDTLKSDGLLYQRSSFFAEPIFRADLTTLLRSQFRDLGYARLYIDVITKTVSGLPDYGDDSFGEPVATYQTLMLKIPVA